MNGMNEKLVDDDAVLVAAGKLQRLDARALVEHLIEKGEAPMGPGVPTKQAQLRNQLPHVQPGKYKRSRRRAQAL